MVEAPEPPHHHHHKTGLPWFDLLVPIAVVCISIASLLTSLQSEKSMHALVEQNQRLVSAQSTPILMLDTGNIDDNGKPVISMTISNVGTGPARIAWFKMADPQGNDYSGGAVTTRVIQVDPHAQVSSQQISATFMRTGDQRSIFRWPKPEHNEAALAEWQKLNHLRFSLHGTACYCSIFDECRITEFGESQPNPVPSCSAETDKLKS